MGRSGPGGPVRTRRRGTGGAGRGAAGSWDSRAPLRDRVQRRVREARGSRGSGSRAFLGARAAVATPQPLRRGGSVSRGRSARLYLMVRRGSTVRVRQRASTIPCKWVFVTCVARAGEKGRTRSARRQRVLTPSLCEPRRSDGLWRISSGSWAADKISGLPARGPRRSVCALSVIMNRA